MKRFLIGLYTYGVSGPFVWALFGWTLLAAPMMTPEGSFDRSAGMATLLLRECIAIAVIVICGLCAAWFIALSLYLGGIVTRNGMERLGYFIAYPGPVIITLVMGLLQSYLIVPPYAPVLVTVACGIIPAFFFPRALIRVAAPWRRRLLIRSGLPA